MRVGRLYPCVFSVEWLTLSGINDFLCIHLFIQSPMPVALPLLKKLVSKKLVKKKMRRTLYKLSCVGVLAMLPVVTVDTLGYAAPAPTVQPTHSQLSFDQLMNIGYAASSQGDFNTALINFRRALVLQPNQPYAVAAADNMSFYIEHARIVARQQVIDQLESRLLRATAASDWVCAATTLDQLTMYTEPNSLNRERLIGQRGEVSGMLDARLNYAAWSTVCAAQRPVY